MKIKQYLIDNDYDFKEIDGVLHVGQNFKPKHDFYSSPSIEISKDVEFDVETHFYHSATFYGSTFVDNIRNCNGHFEFYAQRDSKQLVFGNNVVLKDMLLIFGQNEPPYDEHSVIVYDKVVFNGKIENEDKFYLDLRHVKSFVSKHVIHIPTIWMEGNNMDGLINIEVDKIFYMQRHENVEDLISPELHDKVVQWVNVKHKDRETTYSMVRLDKHGYYMSSKPIDFETYVNAQEDLKDSIDFEAVERYRRRYYRLDS